MTTELFSFVIIIRDQDRTPVATAVIILAKTLTRHGKEWSILIWNLFAGLVNLVLLSGIDPF